MNSTRFEKPLTTQAIPLHMGIVQIATVAEHGIKVLKSVVRYGAERVYLLVLDDALGRAEAKRILDNLEKTLGVDVHIDYVDHLNMPQISRTVREILEKESKAGNKIYLNITSGRKPAIVGMLLAGYFSGGKVSKILYWCDSDAKKETVIDVPLLNLSLENIISEQKLSLLNLLNTKGDLTVQDIEDLLKDKSVPIIHQHLRELRDLGFVTVTDRTGKKNVYSLTDAGKVVL